MSKKISELPALTSVQDADVLPIADVSDGVTRKVTALQLKNYAVTDDPWTYYTKTSDTIASGPTGTALIDVPGLSAPLAANTKYEFVIRVIFSAASNATGIQLAINGPGTPVALHYFVRGINSTSALRTVALRQPSSYNFDPGYTASPGTPRNMHEISGFIITDGASGNLVPRYAAEGVSGEISVYAHSYMKIKEIPQS